MYTDRLNDHSLNEEEYFYKKDRELIEKMHETERKKQELLARTAHYHKCGCCGHDMKENTLEEIEFLQCQHCENVQVSFEMLELMSHGRKLKNLITELQIRKQVEDERKVSGE